MRARNLKPGFFKNEGLIDCDPLARILFAGLWCMADREGRLEDRPRRFKMEILPADNCDVDALLTQLEKVAGVIARYMVGDHKYIQVINFARHQRPHIHESRSTIPPIGYAPPVKDGASTNHGECEHALNPSSLNPSSLNPSSPTPSAMLAREWLIHRKGAHTEHDRKSADNFADLLAAGVNAEVIVAEVRRPERPKTEPIWDLVKRLMPQKERANGQRDGVGRSRIEVTPEMLAHRRRQRELAGAGAGAESGSPPPSRAGP